MFADDDDGERLRLTGNTRNINDRILCDRSCSSTSHQASSHSSSNGRNWCCGPRVQARRTADTCTCLLRGLKKNGNRDWRMAQRQAPPEKQCGALPFHPSFHIYIAHNTDYKNVQFCGFWWPKKQKEKHNHVSAGKISNLNWSTGGKTYNDMPSSV